MGWFGNSSQKQGDEFDLGNPLIYSNWSNTYFSRYDDIKIYMESKIGSLDIKDASLQNKMSNMLLESSKESYEEWLSYSKDFIEVTIDGNNTLAQVQIPSLPEYKYKHEYQLDSIVSGLRRSLRDIGFEWNRRHRTYLKRNSKSTLDEIAHAIGTDKLYGKTKGLEVYCSQVAYRQSLHGIANTWSKDSDWLGKTVAHIRSTDPRIESSDEGKESDTRPEVLTSKSEGGPYSKVEQLERLISLRKKGEITSEEFDSLKKELLS